MLAFQICNLILCLGGPKKNSIQRRSFPNVYIYTYNWPSGTSTVSSTPFVIGLACDPNISSLSCFGSCDTLCIMHPFHHNFAVSMHVTLFAFAIR